MKKSSTLILILTIAIVGALSLMLFPDPKIKASKPAIRHDALAPIEDAVAVEEYVTMHISELSPVQESLGGKFYITRMEAHGGAGIVSYEDGHNAHVADFTYSVDQAGRPTVLSFKVRS